MTCERCGRTDITIVGNNDYGTVWWCEHCGSIHDAYGLRTPNVAFKQYPVRIEVRDETNPAERRA